MNIERTSMMIENINTNQAANMLGHGPMANSDPATVRNRNHSEVALQAGFAELVEQAKLATEADARAVDEARRLLESGRLTSPENIRSAARSILESGI